MKQMQKKQWSDMTDEQRAGVIVTGVVQVVLASAAWTDLARRPASLVNGRKGIWGVVIAINFVGPIAYFVFGRRRAVAR